MVGELLDALDLMASAGVPEPPEVVATQRRLAEHLEHTWHDEGHGLWGITRQPRTLYLLRRDGLGRRRPLHSRCAPAS